MELILIRHIVLPHPLMQARIRLMKWPTKLINRGFSNDQPFSRGQKAGDSVRSGVEKSIPRLDNAGIARRGDEPRRLFKGKITQEELKDFQNGAIVRIMPQPKSSHIDKSRCNA